MIGRSIESRDRLLGGGGLFEIAAVLFEIVSILGAGAAVLFAGECLRVIVPLDTLVVRPGALWFVVVWSLLVAGALVLGRLQLLLLVDGLFERLERRTERRLVHGKVVGRHLQRLHLLLVGRGDHPLEPRHLQPQQKIK